MVSILVKIVVIVVSAIAGGFFGAWFSYRFQSRKIVKVRRIAIKALEIFLNYAKKRQTYDLAASEFNNKINIVENANSTSKCKITKCFYKSTPLVLRNSISFLVSH